MSEQRPLATGVPALAAVMRIERSSRFSSFPTAAGDRRAELQRLGDIQVAQQPLPDFVEALFDYALGQLRSEAEWVTQTHDYMSSKPWLEGRDERA